VKPGISVLNRQRKVRVDLASLRNFAARALEKCLELPHRKSGALAKLREVNVILVADKRIAQIHRRFMNEPGPTDVITFQHGEIFISTETAMRQARGFGTTLDHELRLYFVHGFLHLQGFNDKTPNAAAEMKRVQERIVAAVPCPRLTL
jgi:probable rRNA maturation factor